MNENPSNPIIPVLRLSPVTGSTLRVSPKWAALFIVIVQDASNGAILFSLRLQIKKIDVFVLMNIAMFSATWRQDGASDQNVTHHLLCVCPCSTRP
jgi:hypothetical protein